MMAVAVIVFVAVIVLIVLVVLDRVLRPESEIARRRRLLRRKLR